MTAAMSLHERLTHTVHGWTAQDTSHIHNVPYLKTHDLMRCNCGFYGWVPNGNTGGAS